MKGLKIFFLVLLGFLFVSVAEAKTDIQVNDGFEITIQTLDFDLVAIDFIAIKTHILCSNYLLIDISGDLIITTCQKTNLSNYGTELIRYYSKTVKAYGAKANQTKNEAFSNTGKLNLTVNCNCTDKPNLNKRFKIPFGLLYNYSIS